MKALARLDVAAKITASSLYNIQYPTSDTEPVFLNRKSKFYCLQINYRPSASLIQIEIAMNSNFF